MLSNYADLCKKAKEINGRLGTCVKRLKEIKSEERRKFENPQYRMWSGEIKDLEEFVTRVEEWLNQPPAAEAKRCLLDLKKWSESPEDISLERIEKDWRFLSDSLENIKNIHKQLADVAYESIKKKTSAWVLKRIIEKDLEGAENWAINAKKFADSLEQLESKEVESRLGEKVKREAFDELLGVSNFSENNKEMITRYEELIVRAENIAKNRPMEINEEVILNTYKMDKKIEKRLSIISAGLEEIKKLLTELEWVKEFGNLKDYKKTWVKKHEAMKGKDLRNIKIALEDAKKEAENWKRECRREMHTVISRIERLSNSVKKDVIPLKHKVQNINWDKPDVAFLYEVRSGVENSMKQLREELIKLVRDKDAILLIEEPTLIEDLGKGKGWDFERFFKALKIVLENGLVQIKVKEEK